MSGWGVVPALRVADLPEAIRFYVDRLGFTAEGDVAQPHVGLVRGDARLMLESAADFYGDGYNAAIRRRLGSVAANALYVEADDLEDLHRRLEDEGITIIDPLADRPWGQAEFTVEDPAGNWLTFWKRR